MTLLSIFLLMELQPAAQHQIRGKTTRGGHVTAASRSGYRALRSAAPRTRGNRPPVWQGRRKCQCHCPFASSSARTSACALRSCESTHRCRRGCNVGGPSWIQPAGNLELVPGLHRQTRPLCCRALVLTPTCHVSLGLAVRQRTHLMRYEWDDRSTISVCLPDEANVNITYCCWV